VPGPPEFDIESPPFRVEPTPRWIRVRAGGEWIADSREALLLSWHGPGTLPTYCLPAESVRTDLLTPSTPDAAAPVGFMAPHDVRANGELIEAAAFLLRDPPPPFETADAHWTFIWRDPRIEWYEEATQVHVHARDPRHRVDAIPSERHVRVEFDGELLAESRRPLALFESGLPTRWYLPAEDVRQELLEPSDTATRCPYKGAARFFSVRLGDELHRDLAWSYPDPIPENPLIAGLIAFFNERVDLVVDGERLERPFTPWSLDVRA
jgi:uncharacterized protein (DUF427 family)